MSLVGFNLLIFVSLSGLANIMLAEVETRRGKRSEGSD